MLPSLLQALYLVIDYLTATATAMARWTGLGSRSPEKEEEEEEDAQGAVFVRGLYL